MTRLEILASLRTQISFRRVRRVTLSLSAFALLTVNREARLRARLAAPLERIPHLGLSPPEEPKPPVVQEIVRVPAASGVPPSAAA
jgi:hypothetical protein